MAGSTTVATELPARLSAAARGVADARSSLANQKELLRQVVVQALDEGMTYRAVGKAIGGSTGLVSKIVATPEPTEEDT